MKILFLANHEVTLYNFRRDLIGELSARGHELHLSFPLPRAGEGSDPLPFSREHADYFESLGCTLHDCRLSRRGLNPLTDIALLRDYARLLRALRPDIVLTYTVKPNIYGGLACAAAGVPYLATVTGLGTAFERGALLSLLVTTLYRAAERKARAVFFQNSAQSRFFEQKKIARGRHVLVSGSGVDLSRHRFVPYPAEDDGIIFLFIGRVMREKGIFELLAAFASVHAEFPRTQLHIVGPSEEDLPPEAETLSRKGAVTIFGEQKDVRPYLARASVLVLPSYHEGLSNVLLEAASTGRPVLASNIPGCSETFEEGVTGFGFAAKDDAALAAAMRRFLQTPREDRAKMGEAGRRKMEREFDRSAVVARYLSLIEGGESD